LSERAFFPFQIIPCFPSLRRIGFFGETGYLRFLWGREVRTIKVSGPSSPPSRCFSSAEQVWQVPSYFWRKDEDFPTPSSSLFPPFTVTSLPVRDPPSTSRSTFTFFPPLLHHYFSSSFSRGREVEFFPDCKGTGRSFSPIGILTLFFFPPGSVCELIISFFMVVIRKDEPFFHILRPTPMGFSLWVVYKIRSLPKQPLLNPSQGIGQFRLTRRASCFPSSMFPVAQSPQILFIYPGEKNRIAVFLRRRFSFHSGHLPSGDTARSLNLFPPQ